MKFLRILFVCLVALPKVNAQEVSCECYGGAEKLAYTICLYADNSYMFEGGDAQGYSVEYGTWKMSRDTVRLMPMNNKVFKPVEKLTASKVPGDSVTVIVLDKYGKNITNKMAVSLATSKEERYSFHSRDGKKAIYKKASSSIRLNTLEQIFQQRFEFDTENVNHFVFKLRIPSEWIHGDNTIWNADEGMAFIKKDGTLETFTSHFPSKMIMTKVQK